ncbi:hypothetical protein QJS04_geneDACA000076 [Acorus gramineus]|uniref:Pre-mRNA-processing factor 39 n=1 Tax=Acorus gramineus TaxID=55184 RepID=A0AAV9APY2_ACOGR|nr:hypothetical protein QJS04_geneDACA000076 [Acorus gramineus]
MEVSEAMITQATNTSEYPSVGYTSAESNMADPSTHAVNAAGDSVSYAPSSEAVHHLPDGPSYGTDANSIAPVGDAITASGNFVGLEAAAGHSGQVVSTNGGSSEMNIALTGTMENGNASSEAGGAVVQPQFEDPGAISTEEDRLWGIVRDNCLDFNAWTALIQETEKVAENNILKIRKVYDAFLAEFPLCFGYWKKYADHEARLDTVEKVIEVYEHAVLAVTYSVDIWLHYCAFAISTYEDPDTIRRLFERGLAYVGTDYLSYPLWDAYISYEYSQQQWIHLALIYTRILENPIQQLDRYFNSFKELVASRPLSEIQTAEEAESSDPGVAGEVLPDGVEQSSKPVSAGLTEEEKLEKYVAIREEMYKKAKEYDSKIVGFETAVRRPYFHVRPLDDPELDNWHNYLDFIERGDDFNKVVKLYERCLIACANYPEYWIRYVLCMEASGSMELASNALARASQVFVKKQPEIHLFAASFKEHSGDTPGARVHYQLLQSEISPGLLEAIVKHANMEHRLGTEAADSVYEEAIAAELAKDQSQILPMLYVQYVRFLYLVAGKAEKAREILAKALEYAPLSKPLLEAVIFWESIQQVPKRIDYLDSLVEKFITCTSENPNMTSTVDKEELSSLFLEFLDHFGDAKSIKKAYNRHATLFLRQKSVLVSKKRRADEFLASDNSKLAKTYSGATPTAQSLTGAYPVAPNQWSAGYGQKPPTWPQAPQPQGQQWNPAYAPQAAYNAYGSYGSYVPPQIPASAAAAQSTAYGAYPSTYPAQAYPQQAYAQPATGAVATAVAFAQPQAPAPVPQAYYGGTY